MKKVIAFISLILLLTFVVAVYPVAADDKDESVFTPPENIGIIYANDITTKGIPAIDGSIGEDEYGKVAYIQSAPIKMAENWPDYAYDIDPTSERPASGTIEFYFAYDEDNVYVAFKEYGQTFDDGNTVYADYAMRDNYGIEFGFDLYDMSNYFLHAVTYGTGCWNKDLRLSDGKISNFSGLDVNPEDLYSEFFLSKYPAADAHLPEDERRLFTYGDLLSATNQNATEPYILEVEIRIEKSKAIELYNSVAYTSFASFPNAMYFSLGTHIYRASTDGSAAGQGYSKYLATDISGKKEGQYMDYGIFPASPQECMPYLIVFGDENTVIKVPADKVETDAPAIDTTKVDTVESDTENDVCFMPDTEELPDIEYEANDSEKGEETEALSNSGCGGTVAFTSLVLAATFGTLTAFCCKKKDN